MSRDRHTIFRFAAGGLGILLAWLGYQTLTHPSPWSVLNHFLSVMFMVLCPPCLLTFSLLDVELGTFGVYLVWVGVAFLNAALYAVIGLAYVRMRQKRSGEERDKTHTA